jgi:hypothetical protein
MLSRSSNSELVYLYNILVVSVIIVIVEGKINDRFRTGDDLLNRGEVIVVIGIGYFCLLLEISRATGRERLTGCGKALESKVMHRARYIYRRKIKASGTAERYNI